MTQKKSVKIKMIPKDGKPIHLDDFVNFLESGNKFFGGKLTIHDIKHIDDGKSDITLEVEDRKCKS